MVANPRRQRLTLPIAPLAAAFGGLVTTAAFALMPPDMLGRLVLRSGIPAIVAAAEPPLGLTARLVLIIGVGGAIAAVTWFALFLVLGARTIGFGGDAEPQRNPEDVGIIPVLRRADAHPDAPSRRPVFAHRDLGTPFLEVRARHVSADDFGEEPDVAAPLPLGGTDLQFDVAVDLPVDLDQPLYGYKPWALAARTDSFDGPASADPGRPQVFEPTERFETFELTPMVRANPNADSARPTVQREPRTPRDTQATISALLERLERGVTQRTEGAPVRPISRDDGLQETLGTLRRMATRG